MANQRQVGLFGGAFDPIHVGHQRVAQTLVERSILDEVWFVPVFKHPWAKKLGKNAITPYEHRRRMIELCLEDSEHQRPDLASRLQLRDFRSVSYAFDTLQYFTQKHPTVRFSWIMGSEYLGRFDEFLSLHPRLIDYPFYIYPRAGFPLSPLAANMIALTDVAEVHVSSTAVRESVRERRDISHQVVPSVAEYIAQHDLYAD